MGHCQAIFRLLLLLVTTNSIRAQDKINSQVSESINSFTVNLLRTTSEEAGHSTNVALSPFTVWTLLTVISEGARDNTAKELETVLGLPKNKDQLRNSYRDMAVNLMKSSPGVSLELSNGIFTTDDQKLNLMYRYIIRKFYSVDVMPTNFSNSRQALDTINGYIATATKNRIQNFVTPDDIDDALIFMTSTMHFKGQWKIPFNKTATKKEAFYDDQGNKIGEVDMMFQAGSFPYTRIDAIQSYAVELPYGQDNRMSMIVLLPYKGEKVINVMKLMSKFPVSQIMRELAKSAEDFAEEDVLVNLPKFVTSSDLILNVILDKMGIRDLFNLERANLLGMFPHYLYVRRLLQKAEIEVNEEGTEASAAAGGSFSYKAPPPRFLANKPFIYFIVDKASGAVVFTGKISNPKDLS